MNNSIKKIERFISDNKDIIYILPLIIYITCSLLSKKLLLDENIVFVLKCVKYAVLLPILFKILFVDYKDYSKRTKKSLFFFCCFLIISIFFTTNTRTIIRYLLLILGAYKIDIRKTLSFFLKTELALFCGIIILSLFGIIPNELYYRSGEIRYSLGFGWPTYPALILFTLTCLYLYLRDKKINNYEFIILLVVNICMYFATNTRFELISSILVIAMAIFYKYNNKIIINNYIVNIAKYALPFFTIVSVILANNYNPNNSTYNKINDLTSNRVSLMSNAIKEHGITVFGQNIDWIGQSEKMQNKNVVAYVVDNGYINIILNYGLIFLIILEYCYYLLIKNYAKCNVFIAYLVIILAIHSFINPQLMQIVYNPFLLFLVFPIIGYKSKKKVTL